MGFTMGATTIKRHPFFDGVNWALLRASSRTPEKPRSPITQSTPPLDLPTEAKFVNVVEEEEDEDLDSLFKSAQDLLKAATSGTSGSGLGSTSQSQFSSEEVSEAKTALRMALL
ncbi:hypothetical protein RHSIM_Rhsim03G0103600 [Rhododendron simsii]|uniref:AGC-kinase C-terminal domain-containing protein n=1 Tax=Rhododendron simsii TaxID=118357 RepID=A0A834LV43_RHOSS|nr:hypothetical protein RHSIM_Rhsim03G0103600 [Rhododendron simsii]